MYGGGGACVYFLCMSITVILQKKTRASYVPRFVFGGTFFDKKFGFQIEKNLIATVFKVDGCAFKF